MSNSSSDERLTDAAGGLQCELAELRSSRRRLALAADADRRAIERALHDGVQQHLVALAVDVQRAAALVAADPGAAKDVLDEMATNVRQALDETVELAQRIYPPLIEVRGLASTLRAAAESVGVTTLVDVRVAERYPTELTAALYWSCVEALSCAAPGTQATICVLDADGALGFEVVVAGHYPEALLARIRDRIEALGGRLTVHDAQKGRSRVHGSLPSAR